MQAMWIIDILALRVGGEKDSDKEADTVGCCSLRVEHFTFLDPEVSSASGAVVIVTCACVLTTRHVRCLPGTVDS